MKVPTQDSDKKQVTDKNQAALRKVLGRVYFGLGFVVGVLVRLSLFGAHVAKWTSAVTMSGPPQPPSTTETMMRGLVFPVVLFSVLLLLRALTTALAAYFMHDAGCADGGDGKMPNEPSAARFGFVRDTLLPEMETHFLVAAVTGLAWTCIVTNHLLGFPMFSEWNQVLVTVVWTIAVYYPKLKNVFSSCASEDDDQKDDNTFKEVVIVTAVPVRIDK